MVMTALSLALVWPLLEDAGARRAVGFGALLAAANTALGYSLALWSATRPPNVFLKVVLGGMAARLAAMLAAIVAGLLALGLPQLPLTLSVMSYFTVFLVFELALLHRQTSRGEVQG